MTKGGSTKIVDFMNTGAGVLVLGHDHISHIVKMRYSILYQLFCFVLFFCCCSFGFFFGGGVYFALQSKRILTKSLKHEHFRYHKMNARHV